MEDIQKSEYGICSIFVLIIPGVLVMFYCCSIWGEHCENMHKCDYVLRGVLYCDHKRVVVLCIPSRFVTTFPKCDINTTLFCSRLRIYQL